MPYMKTLRRHNLPLELTYGIASTNDDNPPSSCSVAFARKAIFRCLVVFSIGALAFVVVFGFNGEVVATNRVGAKRSGPRRSRGLTAASNSRRISTAERGFCFLTCFCVE